MGLQLRILRNFTQAQEQLVLLNTLQTKPNNLGNN